MKKIIIVVSVLLVASAFSAMAQTDSTKTAKDRLTEIENMADQIKESKGSGSPDELFSAEGLGHLYVGDHFVDNAVFPGGKSHEVGLNILKFSFNPAEWLSFEIGADIKWDRFIAKGKMFELDTNGQFALSTATPPNRIKSKICAFGASAPAAVSFKFGKVGLKFGADATYDFDRYTKIKNKFRDDNGKRAADIIDGGEIQNFRLSYFGALLFDDFGIYARYCPGTVVPGSIQVENLLSVGIYMGM